MKTYNLIVSLVLGFFERKKETHNWRGAMVRWFRHTAHDQKVVSSNPGTGY